MLTFRAQLNYTRYSMADGASTSPTAQSAQPTPAPSRKLPLSKASTPAEFRYGAYKSGRRSKDLPYLNVAALARKIGVSRTHLNKWFRGINQLSVPVSMRLADALGMPLEKALALGGIRAKAKDKANRKGTKKNGKTKSG